MTHTVDSDQQPTEEPEADPLEDNELARRLRRMEWPTPPVGVKERCLEEILAELKLDVPAKPDTDTDGSGS